MSSILGNLLAQYPGASPYVGTYESAAAKYNVPVSVLISQGNAESGFNPNAVSSTGAVGIAQFEPATAQQFGINPSNPIQSINAQAQYLSQLNKQFGNMGSALQAYNEGPSAFASNGGTAQTQSYANGILKGAGITSTGQRVPNSISQTSPNSNSNCGMDPLCWMKKIVTWVLGFQSDIIFFIIGFAIVLLTSAALILNNDAVKQTTKTVAQVASLAK